jgi:plasmid stability protein
MNAITVHKLSDAALKRIEERAVLNQRSVEDEAAALIERGLEAPLTPMERFLLAEKIAAMTPKDVIQTDSVLLLREDRDR